MFSILQAIILGSLQGILEWLPVSSEGIITLVSLTFFEKNFQESLYFAIWLHMGTLAAALFYFKREIKYLFKAFFKMAKERRFKPESKIERLLVFIVISTLVTGAIGTPLLVGASDLELPASYLSAGIGLLLIITGLLNYLRKKADRGTSQINLKEATGVGIFQAFSILPGLSRSGLTVFYFLARRFPAAKSLKLSFLLSIPAILGGNILLKFLDNTPRLTLPSLTGAFFAFIFGIVTIKSLIKIANKINFAYFCFALGGITILISILIF